MKVLGISTSPRPDGNSERLLRRALEGAESAGADVECIRLAGLKIGPCVECNSCRQTGLCRLDDDYRWLLEKISRADRLIFATPIFFMGPCAQAKMLIDRGQCLWARKYVLKKGPAAQSADRRAMVIAVGGSRSKKQFDCIRLTMKAYFDSLETCYAANLFVNQVDELGQIERHPRAMAEAFRLGAELASSDSKPPRAPIEVELY